MLAPLIQLSGITKTFGGIVAVDNVEMTIATGEVVGLMGDNGAGKSTLVRMLCGSHHPTSGDYLISGSPVHLAGPADARRHGIEVVYQDLALANNLTAAENIFLGREISVGWGPLRFLNKGAMNGRAAELLAELKSETRSRDIVHRMSGGQRQAVAISRTMLADARLVLMDEPTAAISVRQITEVLDLIRRMKARGLSVVLISHRMPDVFSVCDRVVVMRRGRKVADKPIAETSPEEVTGLITGALQSA